MNYKQIARSILKEVEMSTGIRILCDIARHVDDFELLLFVSVGSEIDVKETIGDWGISSKDAQTILDTPGFNVRVWTDEEYGKWLSLGPVYAKAFAESTSSHLWLEKRANPSEQAP